MGGVVSPVVEQPRAAGCFELALDGFRRAVRAVFEEQQGEQVDAEGSLCAVGAAEPGELRFGFGVAGEFEIARVDRRQERGQALRVFGAEPNSWRHR